MNLNVGLFFSSRGFVYLLLDHIVLERIYSESIEINSSLYHNQDKILRRFLHVDVFWLYQLNKYLGI